MDDPIDPKNMVDLFDQGGPATERLDQPVPPTVPSQPDTPEGRSGRRLTSNMLLGARGARKAPGPTPPPRPEFDVVTNGLDAEQVQQYLEVLLNWAQKQVHRAEGAEQTLAEAVSHLRDASTTVPANGVHLAGAGSDGAKSTGQAPLPRKPPRSDKPLSQDGAEPAPPVHGANALRSVPLPRPDGHATSATPRPRDTVAAPAPIRRSARHPAQPSVAVSRLDDRHVAAALTGLLGGSRWDQFRGRRSRWSAFHLRSLRAGSRQIRYTIAAGPSGLFHLSTPYHRGAEVVVDGSRVLVNGRESDDAAPVIEQADQVGQLLREVVCPPGDVVGAERARNASLSEVVVRPVLAFVGVRSVRIDSPGQLIVTTTANLAAYLRALPERLTDTELDAIGALTRPARSGLL